MASLAESTQEHDFQGAREAERRAVNLLVELERGASGSTATVQNVSATGLLVRSSVPISAGETLRVELPHGGMTEATVRWSEGDLHGCEFGRPVTSAALSAALLKSPPLPAGPVEEELQDRTLPLDGNALGPRTKLLIIATLAGFCWLPVLGIVGVMW